MRWATSLLTSLCPPRPPGGLALIVIDPVDDSFVQMPDQDLLVVERELVDDTGFQRGLGAPPSMPASCSANSLSTTDATSCSIRSRTVRAGLKYVNASKRCVLWEVGQ